MSACTLGVCSAGRAKRAVANVPPPPFLNFALTAIMKGTYGPDNQRFTSSSLLIVFNRVFSVLVGLAIMAYKVRLA